jgi:hypothetical protein
MSDSNWKAMLLRSQLIDAANPAGSVALPGLLSTHQETYEPAPLKEGSVERNLGFYLGFS